MVLSPPLRRCLGELTELCESLVSENVAIRRELEGRVSPQLGGSELVGVVPNPADSLPVLPEVSIESNAPQSLTPSPKSHADRGQSQELQVKQVSQKSFRAHSAFEGTWTQGTSGLGENYVGMLGAARLGQLKKADPKNSPENAPLKSIREVASVIYNLNWFSRNPEDTWMATFSKSSSFKFLCTVAIVANTVYLGIAADVSVKNSYQRVLGQDPVELDRTAEYVFIAWFTAECLVNMLGNGWDFWLGPNQHWNVFDIFLVANSILDLSVDVAQNLSFLRVFRVFRLVRVVRLVRTLPSLRSLRTMLFSIISSLSALFWAFVMLLLTMFMFSIIFSNGVAYYFEFIDINVPAEANTAEQVYESFGGIYETLVSLFAAVSGGNDWMTYGVILRRGPGEIYFMIFVFYIFFCLVGLLNVVTGIFVDSAVCTRTEDEVVESFTEEQTRLCGEMKRIFSAADMDRNGFITFEEFCLHVEDPWVQAFLSGLDIDITDARIVFTLLDVDGSGGLTVEEFVDGALKLKGPAKGIDMLSMMFDLVRYNVKFAGFCSFLEEQTREIKELIRPERPGPVPGPRYKTATEELDQLSHLTNRKITEVTMPHLDSSEGFVRP